jgi:hypothetical protein
MNNWSEWDAHHKGMKAKAKEIFSNFKQRDGMPKDHAESEFDRIHAAGNSDGYLTASRIGAPFKANRLARRQHIETFRNAYNHAGFELSQKSEELFPVDSDSEYEDYPVELSSEYDGYSKVLKYGTPGHSGKHGGGIPKSSEYKVIHAASKKIVHEGNKKNALQKMKDLNKEQGAGTHSLGYSHGKTVGDTWG